MTQVFIARQPILNRQHKVIGYELLFRDGLVNACREQNFDRASAIVIADSTLVHGFAALTKGGKAFFNVTRQALIDEYPAVLPAEHTVIELLENVPDDDEVVAACRSFKKAGYQLALDDYTGDRELAPLLDLVDYVKVDFLLSDDHARRRLAERLLARKKILLAEKVETSADVDSAMAMGYSLFQGYYFAKPEILSSTDISPTKQHSISLLQELYKPNLSFAALAEVIKRDVSLSYKLLRFVNSAYFAMRQEVTSIKQALVLLGEREIKKWATLLIMGRLGEDSVGELLTLAVQRARLLELLAPYLSHRGRAEELFLLGLFSLLDAITGRPLEDMLEEISVSPNVAKALLGHDGPLADTLDLAKGYEQADWSAVVACCQRLELPDAVIAKLYLQAMLWSSETTASMADDGRGNKSRVKKRLL